MPKVELDLQEYVLREYHDKIREHIVEIKTIMLDTRFNLVIPNQVRKQLQKGCRFIFNGLDDLHFGTNPIRIGKKKRLKHHHKKLNK